MSQPIVEVVDNDGNGSAPAPSPTPSPTPEVPPAPAPSAEGTTPNGEQKPSAAPVADPKDPQAPAPSADGLVELPDGRKVDPATASKEYRSLLADHTRKSQELAKLKGNPAPTAPNGTPNPNINNAPLRKWEDPNWQPSSYKELLDVGEEKKAYEAEQARIAKEAEDAHLATTIDSQIEEIKKTDPTLNVNALYQHATKYQFGLNLKGAYLNMKDMAANVKKAQEITAQNINKRNADPVAGNTGGVGVVPDGDVYDPSARRMSASDFLRNLKT